MPGFPIYVVDSFTEQTFAGNPAAVCLLDEILPNDELQKIAAEFNLSETAYPLPVDRSLRGPDRWKTCQRFSLRWFTPTKEVKLCGHATLATAHVLFNEHGNLNDKLSFETLSGELIVSRKRTEGGHKSSEDSKWLIMDFPAYDILHVKTSRVRSNEEIVSLFEQIEDQNDIASKIADELVGPGKWLHLAIAPDSRKLLVVIDPKFTKSEFEAIHPATDRLLAIDPNGEFVTGTVLTLAPSDPYRQGYPKTAEGREVDYVSRYFAPFYGIPEDPATGSAQCALAPFWTKKLGRTSCYALQCFPGRGASFLVDVKTQTRRVEISGAAVTVIRGTITL
ncbi:phenazine biosynthesis-like protein domain-containing protein [Ditylenchus destructor]|uniref:Phenazine biosynthesis-like protein domain-containing protein n=1 Tax=Ditylenchus destructor TaxID=166010 RepID=A0AAD4R6N2_9BILA|nr:phenazine biosynthesis-like protein domain-containing protein [Ditylenchus destructor]